MADTGDILQNTEREMPVIPVPLPGFPEGYEMPPFLKRFSWIDLRNNLPLSELERLAEKVRPRQASTVKASSPLQSLHQLPPPPSDFVGREEHLAALRDALRQGRATAIFGLRGMGGVGKTTLALKLAEELTPLYPDAQIYLDLKGVDPQPLTSAQAMAYVLRSFHPDAHLPENQVELAGLYRSVLHGRRAILLMDNASPKGREQVEPLIPPAGSLLLVTSRFHFHLPGLYARDLDEMPIEDARGLLLEIAPRIGEHADPIARLCGCLPLALRVAGRALAERPTLSPADYIHRLSEGKDRLDGVDVSLRASYDLLDEDQRKLWRWLGVFPDTFDRAAVAAVWELDEDSAQEVLDDLLRYSLVEWDSNDERYRLHDLAREFAAGLLEKSEREAARLRHAKHYLGILERADDLYQRGGQEILTGLRLFDAERGNIQAGQAWAAENSAGTQEAADLCSRYPDRGKYVVSTRLHPREQIRWREAALEAARRLGDRSLEGRHLSNLGKAYADLGEPRRAIELYEQNLAITREIGDQRGEASTLNNLGLAYANLGEPRRAIELYEQVLAIAREIGDRRGEYSTLSNLGNAYAVLGEPRRAVELYEQDLAITREFGDRRGEGQSLGNLGNAYAALGEPRRAVELYEQWLAIAREIGDRREEGQSLGSLGNAYVALGEPRRAIELYEQQLALTREIGNRRGEGQSLGNLGNAYAALGEPHRAIELYEQVLAIARETGDRRGEGQSLGNMGLAYADLGKPRRAIELYEKNLAIAREIGDRRGEANVLGSLGLAYADLGEPHRAIEFYEQWLAIAREIGDRRGEGQSLGNLGLAYTALGEPYRAIELYEQQLAIARVIGDRLSEATGSWNLGVRYNAEGDLRRAADLMQILVDFEREIGHPDAEKHAARVEAIRARLRE